MILICREVSIRFLFHLSFHRHTNAISSDALLVLINLRKTIVQLSPLALPQRSVTPGNYAASLHQDTSRSTVKTIQELDLSENVMSSERTDFVYFSKSTIILTKYFSVVLVSVQFTKHKNHTLPLCSSDLPNTPDGLIQPSHSIFHEPSWRSENLSRWSKHLYFSLAICETLSSEERHCQI